MSCPDIFELCGGGDVQSYQCPRDAARIGLGGHVFDDDDELGVGSCGVAGEHIRSTEQLELDRVVLGLVAVLDPVHDVADLDEPDEPWWDVELERVPTCQPDRYGHVSSNTRGLVSL